MLHSFNNGQPFRPYYLIFNKRPGPMADIHQRMRKPHFRAVDDAIARALEHSQKRRKIGIQDELVQAGLAGKRKLSVTVICMWLHAGTSL